MSLATSAALLLATAALLAWRLGRGGAERFWLLLGACALQLGSVTLACSLAGRLEPRAFLTVQAVLLAGAAVFSRRGRTVRPAGPAGGRTRLSPWARAAAGLAGLLLLAALGLSAVRQAATPVQSFDDRMYHASRTLYWIQHRSVLPWESHNDRQVVFPFGSELFFFWPMLLTRAEAAGRVVFWLGFPAASIGLAVVLASLRSGLPLALAGGALFAVTPMVWRLSAGLAPDPWLAAFTAGTVFWAARALAGDGARDRLALPAAGVFFALAVNVKLTALALLPVLAALPWLLPRTRPRARTARLLAAGALAGTVLSGLAVPLVGNTLRDGHPLGPARFRKVHESEKSLRQLATHAVRLPFVLVEPPFVPEGLRAGLDGSVGRLADATGASRTLPLEDDEELKWPGRFAPAVAASAQRYSLGGLAWLLALPAAAAVAARRSLAGRPRPRLLVLLLALAALAAGSVGFHLRWQAIALVPERFLVFAYLLAIAVGAHLWGPALRRRRWVATGAALLLAWVAVPSAHDLASATVQAVKTRPAPADLDEPFQDVVARLPAGSRLLLVGSQDTRDYPLFGPREGITREVTSWGKRPVSFEGLLARVEATGVTHVLLQDPNAVWLQWDPTLDTRPVTAALRSHPRFRELPNRHGRGRLFEVASAARPAGLAAPPLDCSVFFGDGWYGLERDVHRWWRWSSGSGRFVVYTETPGTARLDLETFTVDLPNTLRIERGGAVLASVPVTWPGFRAILPVTLPLHAGMNELAVVSANKGRPVKPDPRPLAMAVGSVRVTLPEQAVACAVQP